jgi:hypothetical protein
MAESVRVELPEGHKKRLIKAAQQDRDISNMRFEEAKLDVTPGRGLELTKRYRFQHVPYNRVYYWRSSTDPEDKDHNDEMLAEIALIEENL